MKKRTLLIGFSLICIVYFALNSGIALAANVIDSDDDGIDDDFEDINKRDIDLDIAPNEITVESFRRSDNLKDQIITTIIYTEDGIKFRVNYKVNAKSEYDFTFNIAFPTIVEFVDVDFNGIYNPEIDKNIQNFSLGEFSPAIYEKTNISKDSELHHLKIQTVNNTFTAHIYFSEEFTLIKNSLITPVQAKIDIEISNFTYLNGSSQLALYTRLESDTQFSEVEETEDEINKYAVNEGGLTTSLEDNTGYLIWRENALIDNSSEEIFISEIMEDSIGDYTEKTYINYPQGENIYHSFKIGIEGLLLSVKSSPLPITVILLVICALSAIAAYSIYHYRKYNVPSKNHKKQREKALLELYEDDEFARLFDSKLALQMLREEDAIDKLYVRGDINLTLVSEDFYKVIERFQFEEHEKNDFIKEMLSLTPHERELFLREMIINTQ
ncbi:MAG: hypothetical protein ACFFEN_04260 [Candidatus Thorarchaeota archaeon]